MKNKNKVAISSSFDQERVEAYLRMMDRILIYNIAVNSLPKHAIEGIVDIWDKVIMRSIDSDASTRTEYMESKSGRLSKIQKEPDGEAIRLHCIEQLKIAKQVVTNNLINPINPDEIDEEGTSFSS